MKIEQNQILQDENDVKQLVVTMHPHLLNYIHKPVLIDLDKPYVLLLYEPFAHCCYIVIDQILKAITEKYFNFPILCASTRQPKQMYLDQFPNLCFALLDENHYKPINNKILLPTLFLFEKYKGEILFAGHPSERLFDIAIEKVLSNFFKM